MQQAAFGTWQSPITASMASAKTIAFCDVVLEEEAIYWTEMRPEEGGRCALLKWTSSHPPREVLPSTFNVRTSVHEYGGAAFTVHQGIVYFIHFSDQRLYRAAPGEMPKVLTPENIRFAEMTMTAFGLVAIAESHQISGEVKNFLALIHPGTGEVKELACGHDFYASPAISSDNQKIAFIAWDHPNMPWDNTMLFIGDFSQSGISHLRQIDSGFLDQSFFQPTFGPNQECVVASDKSNWWNLYQVEGERLIPLFSVESEIGQPLWQLGASRFAFYQGGILCAFEKERQTTLFHFKNNALTPLSSAYHDFSQIRVNAHHAVCLAGAPDKPMALIRLDNNQKLTVIKTSAEINIDPAYFSFGQHITFPSENRESYAYFYPPQNKDYAGLKNTLPPLIVKSHGGPTAQCDANLNLEIQYWTSRGFAFVDVNYTGSSGYGRAYRQRLEGHWGIFDVKDCEAAALFLVQEGLVDENKLAITGRSAGGYTTLAALTFTDTFDVGASLYGVSDLALLTKETHKFESHYLDRLIGPYPAEKQKYFELSPVNHVEKLSKPVIFFQGDEDKVVPPNQAERLYHALKAKGIKTKYCLFQGEQHGFRKAETRITALEEMRQFFLEVLG